MKSHTATENNLPPPLAHSLAVSPPGNLSMPSSTGHTSPLLIDEEPLQVLPGLAVKVGLNGAIFLQQLHYWLRKSKNVRDGHRWVYNTVEEWQRNNFRFWSVDTVKRAVRELEARKIVISIKPGGRDRKKWYRIDYEALDELLKPATPEAEGRHEGDSESTSLSDPSGQSAPMHQGNLHQWNGSNSPDASGQSATTHWSNRHPPLVQVDPMHIKDSENTQETTREYTHTARATSASAGVCVSPSTSTFSLAERKAHAQQHGLGKGWLTNSRDGRYDEMIADAREATQPATVEQSLHAPPRPSLSYRSALLHLDSLLDVNPQLDIAGAVAQLDVSEEDRAQLLAYDFAKRRAAGPQADTTGSITPAPAALVEEMPGSAPGRAHLQAVSS